MTRKKSETQFPYKHLSNAYFNACFCCQGFHEIDNAGS